MRWLLKDYNTENDTISITVSVAYDYGDMLINEIMYDPLTGNPEWAEIANASSSEISVLGGGSMIKMNFNPPESLQWTRSRYLDLQSYNKKTTLNPDNIYTKVNFPTLQ